MNNNILSDGRPAENVDRLLHSFFKNEMPEPWPAVNVLADQPLTKPGWLGTFGRLALVASLALILLGYLALAAKFPSSSEPGLTFDRSQTIGSRISVKQAPLPPSKDNWTEHHE
jgi:hypothetical protein